MIADSGQAQGRADGRKDSAIPYRVPSNYCAKKAMQVFREYTVNIVD